jgi:hypothetical protein
LESRPFRKLQMIDDATTDQDLRVPPSNHFEKLRSRSRRLPGRGSPDLRAHRQGGQNPQGRTHGVSPADGQRAAYRRQSVVLGWPGERIAQIEAVNLTHPIPDSLGERLGAGGADPVRR